MFEQGRFVVVLLILILNSQFNAGLHASEQAELERLKKQLASPVPTQKVQAAGKLAQLGRSASSATEQLIVCLEDTDPDVRLYAAHALAHVSTHFALALQSLVNVLPDRDEHVRYAAEWAIAYLAKSISAEHQHADHHLDDTELAAILISLNAAAEQFSLQEHQPRHAQAVKQAISSLSQFIKPPAAPETPPSDTDVAARAASLDAEAFKLQFQSANRIERFSLVEKARETYRHRPDVLKDLLVSIFETDDVPLADFAVDRWHPESQEALSQILADHSDSTLPQWTDLMLSFMKPTNQELVGRLILIAQSSSAFVDLRTAAIGSLGNSKIQVDNIRIALINILVDESVDELVRVTAVSALAQLGELPTSLQNRALAVLMQSDGSMWLRSELAQNFHHLAPNSTDIAVAIAKMLRTTDVNDAAYAELAIALGKFGPRGIAGLPELIAGISSTDDYICDSCVRGLQGLGPAAAPAKSALVALVANPQVLISTKSEAAVVLRSLGTTAVEDLVAKVPESLTTSREHILHVLAIIGPEARHAIPACIARVMDSDESLRVRVAAVTALGAIGAASASAIPALQEIIASEENVEIRGAALITLAQIDPAAVISAIEGCERESDFTMRISAAFAKHLTGQTAASFRSLLALLGEGDDILVEDALLDLGHVALPLLLDKMRDQQASPLQRIVCMRVASRMNPVDWPPLVEMLADDSLSSEFADALLAGWEFDDNLLRHILIALQQPQNADAKAQMQRIVEYITSDLGAGGDEEQWPGGFAITQYVDGRAREATASEQESALSAPSTTSPSPQFSAKSQESDALIPEADQSVASQALIASDMRQVKVFYGTNRKPLDFGGTNLSSSSQTTFAASIGLAIAACATCAFGFLRKKSPAYALAALAGLGSVSTLAVHGVNLRSDQQPDLKQVKYGGDYSSTVELGMCQVSIPEVHRPGELESPSFLLRLEVSPDPNKHIVLQDVQRLAPDKFYGDLHTELSSRGNNILVFVHGYNVSFEDAARRTAQMSYDLKFPGAPVFYSWPSQANWYRYRTDRANIEKSVEQIKGFLTELANRSNATTINLVAHSMGNVGLTAALSAMDGQTQFNQIVLAAPDIDAETFKQEIAPKIVTRGQRVTLYTSKTDLALIASRYFNHGARAGDSGSEMLLVPGIQTIDATAVDSSLLGHSYYGSNVDVLYDLGQLLNNQPIEKRPYLQASTNADKPYWYFDPKSIANRQQSSIVPLRR